MPLFAIEQHLDNLVRHIGLVRSAGVLLGERIIARGEAIEDVPADFFARMLIAQCHVHDASKFTGIEWDYLHVGPKVAKTKLALAVKHHVMTNTHHPEYWGGVSGMPVLALAEMVCDWYARAQEHGSSLREWITNSAMPKYAIAADSRANYHIQTFCDLLLESSFKK